MARLGFILTICFITLFTAPTALAAPPAQAARDTLPWLWWLTPVGAFVALVVAYILYQSVMRRDEGTERMIEIAQAVRTGAMAYLNRQYRIVAVVFAILFVILLLMSFAGIQSFIVPFAFVTGGFFSALCGFIGMKTATNASARTTHAASQSLNDGLQVAFRAGAVMGLSVVGFALLDSTLWFLILYFFTSLDLASISVVMLSAAMGASTQALFARVGGGIYTKAADVGADLVGKVEAGIPEDDPRNPATIADNVGDNVGDVAGMGADLYESYVGSIRATVALGIGAVATVAAGNASFIPAGLNLIQTQLRFLAAPMAVAGVGVILSIIGIYLVRTKEDATMGDLMGALTRSITISSVLIFLAAIPIIFLLQLPWQLLIAIITGLVVGEVIGRSTEYYTSDEYGPTRSISEQGNTGPATVIISGLAVGMRSTGIPVVAIVIGIGLSFYTTYTVGGSPNTLMGLYGVALAAVSMLSTLGLTLATDAYGPIADNAGGNAEMSDLPPAVRHRTDQLDAVGNTTAATGKGFAIGSAALTALALLASYLEQVRASLVQAGIPELSVGDGVIPPSQMRLVDFTQFYDVSLLNPAVLIGLFAGAMTVFFFSAMTMSAVGRAAGAMVEEVRRQFREMPGILKGEEKPDYALCVAISTAGAQREMVAPSVLAIAVPVIVGVLFGVAGVLGLLAGGLTTGFLVAVMMANSGGAWDNAKKHIEKGAHGGKGSDAHKATVVGDTVGDPFKDTTGPSLNILIKLMSMVSIVFAGLVVALDHGLGLLGLLLGV